MSKIIKAGVIGDPISHSLSPKIHTHWIDVYHINGVYDAYRVSVSDLEKFVDFALQNLAGFNITTPHKENIISFCHDISDTAKLVGGVNTIKITQGHIWGDNTDVFGIGECLIQNAPIITRDTVCLIGAGGACRAGIIAFENLGFKTIIIANRTLSKAQKLADTFSHLNAQIIAIDLCHIDDSIHMVDVLVNTSIAGMNGDNPLSINLSLARPHTIVYDIVYKPLMTQLLTDAQTLGLKTVTGIDMLLYQALQGFSYWFGVMPRIDYEVRKIIL